MDCSEDASDDDSLSEALLSKFSAISGGLLFFAKTSGDFERLILRFSGSVSS